MGKSVFLVVLFAATVAAQDPQRPSPDQQTLAQQTQAWQVLAKGLEIKIARMLPCDARVRTAIEDVSRASAARLAALAAYLQTAAAGAKHDSDAAGAALEAEQAGARDWETENAEAEQDRIAVEAQLADLTASVKSKPALEDARKKLESIAVMIRQRAADGQAQAARRTALIAALKDLVAANQTKQKALENELSSLSIETARWSDYYSARLARAQTECSITNQGAQRKKQ